MTVAGKRVLVMGASSGIGRATALLLARAGARIVAAARREDRLEEVARAAGGDATALACDVRDAAACEAAIAATVARLGGLDGLVYATGATALTLLADATADDWRAAFETNVVGAALLTGAALPHLAAAHGRAIYLSSIAAWDDPPRPGLGLYMATKAALEKTVAVWRAENPEVGFTVVVPGDTITEFGAAWDPERVDALVRTWTARGYLYARPMDPEAVAEQVAHALACRESIDRIAILPRAPRA